MNYISGDTFCQSGWGKFCGSVSCGNAVFSWEICGARKGSLGADRCFKSSADRKNRIGSAEFASL